MTFNMHIVAVLAAGVVGRSAGVRCGGCGDWCGCMVATPLAFRISPLILVGHITGVGSVDTGVRYHSTHLSGVAVGESARGLPSIMSWRRQVRAK